MHASYTTCLELHRPLKGHSPFFLQLQDISAGPPLFLINSSSKILLWLFKILCILFVQKLLIFTVILLNIFLNGLSLSKCLFRRFRKYSPMLMLASLQNGGLNQIILLFLFSLVYLSDNYWSHLPCECAGPTTPATSSIRTGVHWVHILQSTLEFAVFEGFIIRTFALIKNFFTWGYSSYSPAHSIRNMFQYRSCVVRVNIYVDGSGFALTKRFESAFI